VALAGLALLVAAGVVVLWPPPNRVTLENVQRIKEGMNHAEVEEILGPPGDYTTRPVQLRNGKKDPFSDTPVTAYRWGGDGWWATDDGGLFVSFDSADRVVMKVHFSYVEVQQGALERLLWRAKRQWHRWFP